MQWKSVTEALRRELFDVILGKGGNFSEIWLLQHLDFPPIHNECRLQIKQYHNGPCGAVASLQAWFVKSLLYEKIPQVPKHLNEIEKLELIRKSGLVIALSHVLFWTTPGKKGPVRLIIPFPPAGDIQEHEYYEAWRYATLTTMEELQMVITKYFDNICKYGMVPFVCSMVFSRGSARVHLEASKDTLVDTKLEDCYQPIVNLILTGRAVANVFNAPRQCEEDDHPKLGKYGIIKRSVIGFMTNVEKTNKFYTVGSFYKEPYNPIWVIHGNYHYSVLFCENRKVIKHPPEDETFHWYTVTSIKGCLLNKQYTLKADNKKEVTSSAPKMEKHIQVVKDCIQLKWPGTNVGIQGVATERKLCQKKHSISSSLQSVKIEQ